jgi:hypothetical protein
MAAVSCNPARHASLLWVVDTAKDLPEAWVRPQRIKFPVQIHECQIAVMFLECFPEEFECLVRK